MNSDTLKDGTLVVEYRSADGRAERFPDLAAELVRLKVELILARGAQAILAAENATQTIPIVMMGGTDPVVTRLVGDIARPGRNVTGLNSFVIEIAAKRLQLLREAVPGIVRIAALLDMGGPAQAALWKETEVAARSMNLQPVLLDVRRTEHFELAFDSVIRQRADAILIGLGTLTMNNAGRIIDFSLRHRLPLLCAARELVDAGGLMSYGVNYPDLYRRGATYVDKILKGAKPADLPIEQPTKLDLVINMKTAKVLGLTIPSSLLLRADQIID